MVDHWVIELVELKALLEVAKRVAEMVAAKAFSAVAMKGYTSAYEKVDD